MKIGVFDSGLGGLVIAKSFIEAMPGYDYIYYGDTAHLPYGEKTSGQILAYTIEAVKFLIDHDCKIIIIACNTATSIALRYLQQRFIPVYAPKIKVLGVVIPTVEVATLDNARTIGVIATRATVRSHIYQTELLKINAKLQIQEIAAPELVPLIESNRFDEAKELCAVYAKQFVGIDSLILGCTHYPLLLGYFRCLLPNVKIVSQDELMGEKLKNYLERHPEVSAHIGRNNIYEFYVSKLNPQAEQTAHNLFSGIKIAEIYK